MCLYMRKRKLPGVINLLYVILYILIFVGFTGVHLYASYKKMPALRNPTKPVILLAILGMYLEWAHLYNVDSSIFIVLALIFSWLGDVFLIPNGVKWFTIGGILFLISHILFIFGYWDSGIVFSNIPVAVYIVCAVVYIPIVCVLFKKLKPSLPKSLFYPMFFYLLANGTMNTFAWFRLFSGSCSVLSGITTALGACLFFVSDCSLFFVRFDKNCKIKSHFLVMLTYSIGEFLIALGLMFLMIK